MTNTSFSVNYVYYSELSVWKFAGYVTKACFYLWAKTQGRYSRIKLMKKTGIFHHEVLSLHSWDIIMDKLQNFRNVIEELSSLPNIVTYEEVPISEDLLLKVHSKEMLEEVKSYHNYEAGIRVADGCVKSAEKIWTGKIDNAFLTLTCCHHAGPTHAWGGCTVSGTGPMVVYMREWYKVRRFAILDTDSHHGDGTRALFMNDKEVLHVCFCSSDLIEDDGTKIDVDVGWHTTDNAYLEKVRRNFHPRVMKFKPDIIFHILGHDCARGDYGDRGVTRDFFPRLVREVKDLADEVCHGRYIVGLGGGSRFDIAEYITPRIVKILCEVAT